MYKMIVGRNASDSSIDIMLMEFNGFMKWRHIKYTDDTREIELIPDIYLSFNALDFFREHDFYIFSKGFDIIFRNTDYSDY